MEEVIKKTPSRSKIKEDLLNQLNSLGKCDAFYVDMVEDYMMLYDLKKKLKQDIKTKGLRYKATNGNGFEVDKPNESIVNFPKINTQMLKILNDLGLKEPSDEGDDDDYLCPAN